MHRSEIFNICDPANYLNALVEYKKKKIIDKNFAQENEISIEESREILDELSRLGALKSKSNLSGVKTYTICDPRICYIIDSEIDIS